MLNKNGTTEDMIEYHPNGKISYKFFTDSDGFSGELTFDKHERTLTIKASNGYTALFTRDEEGNELAYKDIDGFYEVKEKEVTKEEYDAFILSLEKQEPNKTAMQELIYEIQQEIRKSAQGENLTNRTGEYRIGLSKAIGFASDMLEKEKKQIINAYWDGGQDDPNKENRCQEYYNKTYNQNK